MSKSIKYINTGNDWYPEIPEHWSLKKIKYQTKFLNGYAFKADEYVTEDGIPIIRIGDVKNPIDLSSCIQVPKSYLEKAASWKVNRNDILLALTGATIGKSAIFDNDELALLNQRVGIIRPQEGVLNSYLKFIINSDTFRKFVFLECDGGAQENIGKEEIGNYFIPLPSEKEQLIISNFLEQKTAELDNIISKKQKLIDCLKEERLVQIRLLTTKGVENKQFKNSGIDWIGEIPKEWEVKKLKYVSHKVQTGNTPPTSKDEYYGDDFNWYTPADFSDNLLLENSSRKISFLALRDEIVRIFPENSVLIVGIGATLGKVGYITSPASSNQQINAIVFSYTEEAKFYANLFYAFKDVVLSKSNASTLAILNQAQTKDFIVPVPTELELPLIVREIEALNTRIEGTIRKIEQEIELIKEYRTSLINEVLTGKITLN